MTQKKLTMTKNMSAKEVEIVVYFTKYVEKKVRGFANVSIYSSDGTFLQSYSDMKLVEHEGKLFMSESQSKSKDGKWYANYVAPIELKDSVLDLIKKNNTDL